MLFLVRHAMPIADPTTDPSTWTLSSEGLAAARRLAKAIPAHAWLVSSDEPKAWQTLDPEGIRDVRRDHRLREVRRVEAFSDEFRQLRRSYVKGSAHDGWERHTEVAQRFGAAVSDAAGHPSSGDMVIASHGMAMTVWLSRVVSLPEPGTFWAELQFPDLLAVDLQARTVQRRDWR